MPSSSTNVTAVYSTVAAGDIVQNVLRPSILQPAGVRVAVVRGQVRSWPSSLTALAMTTPSRAMAFIEARKAAARRRSRAAACQRRTMLRSRTRCMLTPIAIDASPRASRLEATTTSWTDVTPRPPHSTGIGAVKYPARLSASMAACGNDASRSWSAARLAKSWASASAVRTRRAPGLVLAVSSIIFGPVIATGGRDGSRPPSGSVSGDLDGDGHAVGDHVVDGRALLGALDDLAQLLGGRVAGDAERDADALEAVARLIVDAERAAHVHVAGQRRLDRRELHLARRGDVDDRGCQARGQRVQQVLGGVWPGVGAEQDRRLARVELECLAAAGVLAAGGIEALDRRAVVGSVDPAVAGAELELRQLRSCLDQIQRREHLLGIHAVADRACHCGHYQISSVLVRLVPEACCRAARATSATPPNPDERCGGMHAGLRRVRCMPAASPAILPETFRANSA